MTEQLNNNNHVRQGNWNLQLCATAWTVFCGWIWKHADSPFKLEKLLVTFSPFLIVFCFRGSIDSFMSFWNTMTQKCSSETQGGYMVSLHSNIQMSKRWNITVGWKGNGPWRQTRLKFKSYSPGNSDCMTWSKKKKNSIWNFRANFLQNMIVLIPALEMTAKINWKFYKILSKIYGTLNSSGVKESRSIHGN